MNRCYKLERGITILYACQLSTKYAIYQYAKAAQRLHVKWNDGGDPRTLARAGFPSGCLSARIV